MSESKAEDKILVLKQEDLFRDGEAIQIQMSNEFPDYIGVLHKHKFIEVVYILSGSAMHYIEGESRLVGRGDLFIINMDTPHSFEPVDDSSDPFLSYDLMFTAEFFDKSLTGELSIESLNDSYAFYSLFGGQQHPYFSVSGSSYTVFGELFHRIYLEYRGREKGYLEIIRGYMIQLIITIFRLNEAGGVKAQLKSAQPVEYVLDYIRRNYNRRISASELAERVYFNQDYLARIFKEQTGYSITGMVQKVRVENVCKLLSTTNQTIFQIARDCGFEDMKFFYKVFKKYMGVLPSEYRKHTSPKNIKTLP
ncbi:MAG: helix-turn-helix domain-containing protein [Clostridia bacterium]|nr:helix-turn-helix domain-containing protein [Clostridia bacterium]